jgi:hypothetical protein
VLIFCCETGENPQGIVIVGPVKKIMKGILTMSLITLLFASISPVCAEREKSSDPNTYTEPLGDEISLHETIVPFEAKKHKIKRCQILDGSSACLIDDKPVFGTDWDLPKNQGVKASVIMGSNTDNLDVSCMYNQWFGKPDPQNFTVEKVEGAYLDQGSFSDGAGSYKPEWLIIQNRSVRTKVDNKEC